MDEIKRVLTVILSRKQDRAERTKVEDFDAEEYDEDFDAEEYDEDFDAEESDLINEEIEEEENLFEDVCMTQQMKDNVEYLCSTS